MTTRGRLLLVSHHFPPDSTIGSVRVRRMALHLRRLGWQVDVLAARALYQVTLDPEMCHGLEGVAVHRTHALDPRGFAEHLRRRRPAGTHDAPAVPMVTEGSPGAPGPRPCVPTGLAAWWRTHAEIPDSRIGWLPVAVAVGSLLPAPHVLLATVPVATSALVAGLLARRFRVPLVLDYRDPWTARPEWPSWRRRLEARLEGWCVRNARELVATTPGIVSILEARFGRPVRLVTNACDAERFVGVVPRRFDRPTVVYAGGLYADRTLEPVMAALGRLRASGRLAPGDLQLLYMGRAPEAAAAAAAAFGVSDFVTIEGVRPSRDALEATLGASCNLSIVGESHAPQIPAKLFEHLAAGRPMLSIAPRGCDVEALLAPLAIASCVPPDDADGLDAAFLDIARGGARLPTQGIPEAFTAEATMARLDGILRSAQKAGHGSP